jgi:hypothetical protein
MLELFDDLFCQLFHARWAAIVSYSRQGAWRCAKGGCRAQARRSRPAIARLERLDLSRRRAETASASAWDRLDDKRAA